MIREIYNELTFALKRIRIGQDGLPVVLAPGEEDNVFMPCLIAHIDLWNQNVEFVEEDEAWARPAVFIEFGEITWDPYKGPDNGMKGTGEVRFHVVTDWKGSADDGADTQEETLADYELTNKIYEAMLSLRGTTFRNVSLSRTLTNHNHQELLENIEVYKVTYERAL